jgi:hypothetical protein
LGKNLIDVIAKSSETAERYKEKPLLAEHALAALSGPKNAGAWILWDASSEPITLDGPAGAQAPGNLRLLKERSCDMMSVGWGRSSGSRHCVSTSHHVESFREEQQEQNAVAGLQPLLQLDG